MCFILLGDLLMVKGNAYVITHLSRFGNRGEFFIYLHKAKYLLHSGWKCGCIGFGNRLLYLSPAKSCNKILLLDIYPRYVISLSIFLIYIKDKLFCMRPSQNNQIPYLFKFFLHTSQKRSFSILKINGYRSISEA